MDVCDGMFWLLCLGFVRLDLVRLDLLCLAAVSGLLMSFDFVLFGNGDWLQCLVLRRLIVVFGCGVAVFGCRA